MSDGTEKDREEVDDRIQALLDDVPSAAKTIWNALSDQIEADYDNVDLQERNGAIGAVWHGALNQVFQELWPFTHSAVARDVPGALTLRRDIHRYLKTSGNALYLGPGGSANPSWWVRAAWNQAPMERRPAPTAAAIHVLPEDEKRKRRERILNRLIPALQGQDATTVVLKDLLRLGRMSSVTMYGLFGNIDGLRDAVNDALPKLACRYIDRGCDRAFKMPAHLGRHEQHCPYRPGALTPVTAEKVVDEKRDEEISVMTDNMSRVLRPQINELKRRYLALIAFATLEGVPVPRSVMDDLPVAGFSIDVRRTAFEEIVKSGAVKMERSGGAGEGRSFTVVIATDPRAALKGSSVDRAPATSAVTVSTVVAPVTSTDYHAVLNGLLAELDDLRKRDQRNAALREALKGLTD